MAISALPFHSLRVDWLACFVRYNSPMPLTHKLVTLYTDNQRWYSTMAVFTSPASQTRIGALPPELTKRIFDHAFAGRSPDVASCRLACQELHILASPYLINSVVIAERLDALRKVREIMLHPYFSQHVTHLIWDASYYSDEVANQYDAYQTAFERCEHLASLEDEAFIRARQTDIKSLETILSPVPRQAKVPASLHGTGPLLQYGMAPPSDNGQGAPLDRSENALTIPDVRDSLLYMHAEDFQDRIHIKGCHLGFADYHRRWMNQVDIRGKD